MKVDIDRGTGIKAEHKTLVPEMVIRGYGYHSYNISSNPHMLYLIHKTLEIIQSAKL